jgi:hypothetical protein
VPSGYVYVQGKFFAAHQDEIKRLLENEAERAAEDNPLARVMEWQAGADGTLTVTTTTEHLARRLGRALNKAFRGKVRYDVRVKREAVLVHLVFGTHGQNAFWRTFGDEQPRFPAADHHRNPPPFKIKRDLAQFFVPLRVRVLNRERWCDGVLEQDN